MAEQLGVKLKEYAEKGDMDGFEEVWLEALEKPGQVEDFLDALDILDKNVRKERTLALMPLVIEIYEKMDKHEEVILAARSIGLLKPRDPAVRRALIKHLRIAHKGEEWIELFLRESGIVEGLDLDKAIMRYDSYQKYKPGDGVIHGSGWGPGVVIGYNDISRDVKVKFEDNHVRELPLDSAVESLKPLDPDDLRVMLMTRPEELAELAKNEPAHAIRKVLKIHRRGEKLSAAKIKQDLIDVVVSKGNWAKWWTRAKQEAAKDPFLEVTGGSRPIFQLRDKPVSIEEEVKAQLAQSENLEDIIKRSREYFAAKPSKELKKILLDEVEDRLKDSIEQEQDPGPIMDALILIEEKGGKGPKQSWEYLREILLEGEEEDVYPNEIEVADLIRSIPSDKGKALVLKSFMKAFPETWAEIFGDSYFLIPRNLLDPIADHLTKKGKLSILVEKFYDLSHSPWRAPWSLFYLARRVISGGFKTEPEAPRLSEVALSMLLVLESAVFNSSGTIQLRRELVKRYEELFFDPKRNLMEKFIEEGTMEEIRRAFSMIHLTSKVPEGIQEYLRSEISYKYPEFKSEDELPLWEELGMLCTRQGILDKQEELRLLLNEKIPNNSAAIGKAAALGDLSENSEWTAALEDQRLLTEKAAQIEDELENTRAIEDQVMPKDIVTPGVEVTFRRADGDEVESMSILGPWDAGSPGVVSYKAPMAYPLLGKKVGAEVTVNLPDRTFKLTILSIEPIVFD